MIDWVSVWYGAVEWRNNCFYVFRLKKEIPNEVRYRHRAVMEFSMDVGEKVVHGEHVLDVRTICYCEQRGPKKNH